MSPLSDALQNPSAVLADLYEKNKGQGIDVFPSIVTSHFASLFSSEDDFRQIRVLDLNHPPDSFAERSLVVFNAMVQDTSLSPELYLATQATDKCGGWGFDLLDHNESSDGGVQHENLRECNTFWAVSIPSISPWCYTESLGSFPPHRPPIIQKHKFPLPNIPHIGVQLKIYDDKLANPIRTTDIMSFVGILGTELLHANNDLLASTHVPTLHTLFCVPLLRTLIPRSFPESSILPSIQNVRQELIRWIANEALGGDIITAEWVLVSTLSHVRSRHPPILPLSLTISGFPPPPADNPTVEPALYHVLSEVFPLVTLLPLTLETLNNTDFYPESKDEDLHSGWLQQPKGTVMMLTEGAITEGGVFSKGMTNIRATQQMMNEQELEYIFPFSSFRFETDVNFLITTEGQRSTFFKTDMTVPLQPTLSITNSTANFYKSVKDIILPPAQILLNFRQLVGGALIGTVTVGDSLGKYVEEDFVRERSSEESQKLTGGKTTFGPGDLIQRMLLARSIAMSLHHTEVTIADWEATKELERKIKVTT